jgi:hypothetical protein
VDPFHPGDIGCVGRRLNFLHNANVVRIGIGAPNLRIDKMRPNEKVVVRRELPKIASVISEFPTHTMRLSCSASRYCWLVRSMPQPRASGRHDRSP